jgi:Xaa-Pro aminopeptidase
VDRVSCQLVRAINPSTFFKSQKTAFELGHVRRVMEDDGVALCAFFAWLEDAIACCDTSPLNELMIDEQLLVLRSQQPGFVSRSFGTIAAYNANGAMPHYRATSKSFAQISGDGLLLIDSGGQYVGGTTDITRVVPVGQPSAAQKDDYTAVLQAMIALSRLRFPRGVASPMIDAVARAPLWARLAEYGHGTGHGVGYYLNVHEGPQVISYRAAPGPHTAMQPGMITSNEPGLYRPGRWGIRIENLVCNVSAGTSEFGEFLEFETLTLCPIDTRCVQRDQLRQDEVDWINAYHAEVRRRLAPKVSGPALAWMMHRTEALR